MTKLSHVFLVYHDTAVDLSLCNSNFSYINILLILQEFLNFASYNLIKFYFIQCGTRYVTHYSFCTNTLKFFNEKELHPSWFYAVYGNNLLILWYNSNVFTTTYRIPGS